MRVQTGFILLGTEANGEILWKRRRTSRVFFFSLALQPPWALASAFQFHDHFTDGRTPWTSDRLVARPLPKHRINAYTHQTSMPCVGFEPTIPASERAKTVHALDRSSTVTGNITSMVSWNVMPWSLVAGLDAACFSEALLYGAPSSHNDVDRYIIIKRF
jgi:hypothetical protein